MTVKNQVKQREAREILETIEQHGFEARLAGGCVRDRLLGIEAHDFDIASTAKPEEISSIFRQKNFKVIPTGIEHGTVTVVAKHSHYEITTLRKDVNTDGRHASVEFGESFEEDAQRRDFTINAMFEDRHGQIYDYFDGQAHLEKRELHFVGDAHQRIQEDYLRILRLFRFWARFNCTVNKQTLQAVEELAAGLGRISQERITQELMGMLEAEHLANPLKAMFESQVMVMVLPEASSIMGDEILATKTVKQPFRGLVRLSLLLRKVVEQAQISSIARKLKLSKKQEQILIAINIWGQALDQVPATQSNFMALADQCESIVDHFFLGGLIPAWKCLFPQHENIIKRAQVTEETKRYLRKSALPIDTKELMIEFNLVPGPKLGELKNHLLDSFRNEEWHTNEEGLRWLEAFLNRSDSV